MIEAPALQRIVDLTRAVGGDHDERHLACLDGADLRNRDLEVGEQLEQERLELFVRPVDLVDQQHGRRGVVVVDRIEQGTAQQELRAEDLAFGGASVGTLAHEPDVQELARIVPLVDGVRQVDSFVALEPDQPRAQHIGHDLGRLGLADARLAFDEERLLELERKEDRGGKRAVADVAALAQAALDVLDRHGSGHGDKEYEEAGLTRPGPPGLYWRPSAWLMARLVSTRARCFLYSGLARRSPAGSRPSDACCAASSGLAP